MARAKRFSDVRRMLRRKLATVSDSDVERLRDELWDVLIDRRFMRGDSVARVAEWQPNRRSVEAVENALRRRYRAGLRRG